VLLKGDKDTSQEKDTGYLVLNTSYVFVHDAMTIMAKSMRWRFFIGNIYRIKILPEGRI